MSPDRIHHGPSSAPGFRSGLSATLRELRIAASRQHLRRLHPEAREEELDEMTRAWLGEGPETLGVPATQLQVPDELA